MQAGSHTLTIYNYWIKSVLISFRNLGLPFTVKFFIYYAFARRALNIKLPNYSHSVTIRKSGPDLQVLA